MMKQSAGSWSRTTLAVLLVAVVVAPGVMFAQDPPTIRTEPYLIGIGDVLMVSVWKNEELTVRVPVRPDGRISLPLVGEVSVGGRTPDAVRTLLTESYKEYITSPGVSVLIEQINSRKVFVMGEVQLSGAYDILRPTRLLQALAMAGGMTEFAKKDQVVVLREEGGIERRTVVSIKEIQTGKRLDANMLLRPGDTIIVP